MSKANCIPQKPVIFDHSYRVIHSEFASCFLWPSLIAFIPYDRLGDNSTWRGNKYRCHCPLWSCQIPLPTPPASTRRPHAVYVAKFLYNRPKSPSVQPRRLLPSFKKIYSLVIPTHRTCVL